MKVAVLSDIHANYQALEAVVSDLKKNNCEKVLCLGDLALAGPQPRMVIDFVRNQKDWTVIQGNTDQLIGDFSPAIVDSLKKKFPVMANALLDDVLYIEDDKKEYLKNLPAQKSIEVEGVKVLLVHGSPRRNNEDIMPDMPVERVEEMLQGVSEDLILCGHTHIPCGYQTNSKQTVVNVGSVGRPMTANNNDACYCIIDFANGSFTVEHRFVDYDKETASAIMLARGYDGVETLAQMILKGSPRHA